MSQISANGDFLRMVSKWLEERANEQKRKVFAAENEQLHNIYFGNEETKFDKARYHLKKLWNEGGFSILKLLQYMSKMANTGLVDNKALRYLENVYNKLNRDDGKFVDWVKKHPSISSYLSYYMVVALIGGTIGVSHKYNKDVENIEQQKEIQTNQNKIYDITDSNFVNDFIKDNWQDIVISMLEFETYYGVSPTKNIKETHNTYGPGLTYVYILQPDGTYEAHRCKGKYSEMVQNFTDDQIWEQFKIHIGMPHGTLDKIRKNLKTHGINQSSTQQIIALLIAGYQRPKDICGIIHKLSKATTLQEECDAFAYYKIEKPGDKKFYNGTMKRRWWCAALYTDILKSQDLLNIECDVFAKSKLCDLFEKDKCHFKLDNETVDTVLSTQLSDYDKDIRSERNLFVGTVEDFIKENKVFDSQNESLDKTKARAFYNAAEKMKHGRTYDATHLFVKSSGEYSA